MRGLRILLVGRAATHEASVRAALRGDDRIVGELPADVVVVPAESWADLAETDGGRDALSVALGGDADTSLDARVDAVWSETPGREEIDLVIERAREQGRQRDSEALSPALQSIVASLETRDGSLRTLLEREKATALQLGEPPRIGESRWIEIDDEAAFADLVRHEAQRARREATLALVCPFDDQGRRLLAHELRPHDVVLRSRVGGNLALCTNAAAVLIAHARAGLGDYVYVLPDELARFASRETV